jgi:hypothetical protein
MDLARTDPSLPTLLEGTPTAEGRAEGVVQRVVEPGSTCRGANCPAGTLTWTATILRMTPAAGGPIEGRGTLSFQGPAGTCIGTWYARATPVADLEILLRLSIEPPGPIDQLRALTDSSGVAQTTFELTPGTPARWWVSIRGAQLRSNRQRVERELVLPAEIELRLGGRLIETAGTDDDGVASFEFLPPEDAPQGRSTHKVEVFARHGDATGSLTTQATLERGLQEIIAAIEPIESPQPVGSTVTVKGRVYAVAVGLFLDPVDAHVTINTVGKETRASTDASGFFSVPVEISSDAFDARFPDSQDRRWEALTVTATPTNRDRYRPGSGSVRFVLVRQGELSVTVLTDRAIYDPDALDDPVVVSGQVLARGTPIAATVQLTYDGGPLAVVESGADGRFLHRFSPAASNRGEPPGSEHTLAAVAQRTGYITSRRALAVLVAADKRAACETGQALVLHTTGRSTVSRRTAGDMPSYTDLVVQGKIVPGALIETTSSTAALGFDVGEGTGVTVVIGAGTRVEVARYCREASGRVRIGLVVDKPGNIVIDRRVFYGGAPSYEIQVVTPTVAISDLKTRYFVHVEEDGTTTVAVLDGSVTVMRPEGGGETDVLAGEQITIRAGDTPDRSRVLALHGQVDPRLVEAIDAASGAMSGEAPGAPDDAARLAELQEIERAVMTDGRWVLVRTETGAYVITVEQLEDHATLKVETGAIRPEERADLVQRVMRESREAFQELIQPEIEALQARLNR